MERSVVAAARFILLVRFYSCIADPQDPVLGVYFGTTRQAGHIQNAASRLDFLPGLGSILAFFQSSVFFAYQCGRGINRFVVVGVYFAFITRFLLGLECPEVATECNSP